MSHPYPLPYPGPESSGMKRPSFISVARQIRASEGMRGFYRGLTPCFIRAFPSNACAFFVYEGILRVLGAEQVGSLSAQPEENLNAAQTRFATDVPYSIW
jgi:solute carrier family 25 carnitine/acylcarnitine transporter 20/29